MTFQNISIDICSKFLCVTNLLRFPQFLSMKYRATIELIIYLIHLVTLVAFVVAPRYFMYNCMSTNTARSHISIAYKSTLVFSCRFGSNNHDYYRIRSASPFKWFPNWVILILNTLDHKLKHIFFYIKLITSCFQLNEFLSGGTGLL